MILQQILMLLCDYNSYCADDLILFASYESITKFASFPVNFIRKSGSLCSNSSLLNHKVLFRETYVNNVSKDDAFELKEIWEF